VEKEGIKWTSDLLKQFSEETGLPLDLVRKMYYYYVDEVRRLAKEEGSLQIKMDKLGSFTYTLHSAMMDLKKVKMLRNEEVREPLIKKFENKKRLVEEVIREDLKTKQTSRHFKIKKKIQKIKNN
jgi:hypothetical protein